MTDLLVLLWMGDVAVGLSALLGALGLIAALVGCGICAFFWCEVGRKPPLAVKALIACGLSASLIATAIPSRQWFYMAAGGVATAKALDSTIGQKVTKLVEQKLDEALGEVKK